MALHSSMRDFMSYQQTNIFFGNLKQTPPQRLKYFFVPELDYNGYLHVVRDQEAKKVQQDFKVQTLMASRQRTMKMNKLRADRRARMEEAFLNHQPFDEPPIGAATVESRKTLTQKWSDKQKRVMEARAISMIEKRISKQAEEVQMLEGWRSASQTGIREKFRNTVRQNKMIEERLLLPHTIRRASSTMGFNHPGFGYTGFTASLDDSTALSSTMGETQITGTEPAASMSPGNIEEADDQVAGIMGETQTVETNLEGNGEATVAEPKVQGKLDELDAFESTLGDRAVETHQRLRSLSLDATTSWTRPVPKPDLDVALA